MVDLAYSLADQNVATTKSMGIYNLSVQLAQNISRHALLQNLTVFSNHTVSSGLQLSPKTQVKECNSAIQSRTGRVCWDQWGVYRCAQATGHPWLFLPKGFCSFMLKPRMRVAAYVHDIMGDYYGRNYPGFVSRIEAQYFASSLRATLRQARVIFTNTEFSKNELVGLARRRGLAEPKVIVTGYGFDASAAGRSEKEDRVLLFASKLPHKRTDIATRFLQRWLRESNYKGVIDCIGILCPRMTRPTEPNWNWIGRVTPEQGRNMIRRARAVVYVSEYEGFGMPPVEAVLEGTCPVFSDIPPLREVMGGTGCPFSNDSETSFLQAMDWALATLPETIQTWSQQLLHRHNWPAVTEKIMRELAAA